MLLDTGTISPAELAARTGWVVKPEGACRGEVCVPLRPGTVTPAGVDVVALAGQVGLGVAADPGHGVWALGPQVAAAGRALDSAAAPDLALPALDGTEFALSGLRGSKVVLVWWASWCSCCHDLPVWQELRARLRPRGTEIVTIALDAGGAAAARPHVEAAGAEHPALVDAAHRTAELFGIVNVPSVVWVDEHGMIVRPAEPGWPGRSPRVDAVRDLDPAALPPQQAQIVALSQRVDIDPAGYLAMLLDWVDRGQDSRYALTPDQVVALSAPRSDAESRAAAHFELACYHHAAGRAAAAAGHWRQAQALAPDNWAYKRQAWHAQDPGTALAHWAEQVRAAGPENYYRRLPR